MDKEKTLLVIIPGKGEDGFEPFFLVVADTGEELAWGFASGSTAKNLLYDGKPERRKTIEGRFGEVEVKYIDETDLDEDELLDKNEKWVEAANNEQSESVQQGNA